MFFLWEQVTSRDTLLDRDSLVRSVPEERAKNCEGVGEWGEGAILTRKNLNLEDDETGVSPEGTRSGVLTPVPSRIQGIFSEVQEYEGGSADTHPAPDSLTSPY